MHVLHLNCSTSVWRRISDIEACSSDWRCLTHHSVRNMTAKRAFVKRADYQNQMDLKKNDGRNVFFLSSKWQLDLSVMLCNFHWCVCPICAQSSHELSQPLSVYKVHDPKKKNVTRLKSCSIQTTLIFQHENSWLTWLTWTIFRGRIPLVNGEPFSIPQEGFLTLSEKNNLKIKKIERRKAHSEAIRGEIATGSIYSLLCHMQTRRTKRFRIFLNFKREIELEFFQ